MDSKVTIPGIEPLPLHDWLDARRDPATLVAGDTAGEISLAQLRSDVSVLYRQLTGFSEQRWVLCIEDYYLFIVGLLALLHAGKQPVLTGHRRPALLNEQISHFDAVLSLAPLEIPTPVLLVKQWPISSADDALPAISDSAAIELFTSGSSGLPKKIRKTVRSMDTEARLLAEKFSLQLQGTYIASSVIPLHLYGLTFGVWLAMSLGIPVLRQQLTYAEQLSALPAHRCYTFISSPAFLKRVDISLNPPQVNLLFSAGGELAWHYQQAIRDWCGTGVDEIYGSSETGIIAHRYREDARTPWTCLPGISLESTDAGCRIFTPLLEGSGPCLVDDRIQRIDEHHFYFLGRAGRVIKIEEKRISLDETEQRILKLNGIADAAVITVNSGDRVRVAVLVVPRNEIAAQWTEKSQAWIAGWRSQLKDYLEPVAIPRYWKAVDHIPVNSMNKRSYKQLQEIFLETV